MIEKYRRKLVTGAIVSLSTSLVIFIGIFLVYYLKFGYLFKLIVERYPDLNWFVFFCKTVVFGLCPVLCFLLAVISIQILHYLKIERNSY